MYANQTRTLKPVGKESFRNAMGLFATGVAVLTTAHEGRYYGVTINSLTSVSLDPFLLLVCLNKSSVTGDAMCKRGDFMVSLLAEAQLDVSRRFVGKSEDRFSDIQLKHSENGIPMPAGCVAYLSCTVRTIHDGGDHDIIIAEVVACDEQPGKPLVFWRGRYGGYQPTIAV
jgi:3-hydroxy-9,10-secoandrosta-1,3,5(10)-triene-9,17-dione monooxygenase reductase component